MGISAYPPPPTVDSYKVLGSLSSPTPGTYTTIYTAPASGGAIVGSLVVANKAVTPCNLNVVIWIGGIQTVPNPLLRYGVRIPELGTVVALQGLCLGPGDVLKVAPEPDTSGTSPVAAANDFTLSGIERSVVTRQAPKCFGILDLQSAGAGTFTLYTVPAGKSAIVKTLNLANYGSILPVRVRVDRASGGTITYLLYDLPLPFLSGGGVVQNIDPSTDALVTIDLDLGLSAGDAIKVETASSMGLAISCWGIEVT